MMSAILIVPAVKPVKVSDDGTPFPSVPFHLVVPTPSTSSSLTGKVRRATRSTGFRRFDRSVRRSIALGIADDAFESFPSA